MRTVDIIVLGDGIVARSVALSAESLGFEAVCVARPELSYENDPRSYAIAPSSLKFLNAIGVYFTDEERSDVQQIEIGFGKAFTDDRFAFQKSNDVMMHMIDHSVLARRLSANISGETIDVRPDKFTFEEQFAVLPDQDIRAPLIIIAEGRNSASARSLGISYEVMPYAQTAITAKFKSGIPHKNIARQLFTEYGPLGILPHGEDVFSIVWSQDDAYAQYLLGLSDDDFTSHLESLLNGMYGTLTLKQSRNSFPVSHSQPSRLHGERFALAGDCAHSIHPLAGQGLNLGLRDVVSLMELLVKQKRLGLDIGDEAVLKSYASWRKGDMSKLGLVTKSLKKFSRRPNPILPALNLLSAIKYGDINQKLAELSDAPLSPQPKYLVGVQP